MANKKEIGAYSAYAIAVKYGFEGTEREWVEANDIAREAAASSASAAAGSASSAEQSATNAAGSASAAKSSETAASSSASAAKTSETNAKSSETAAASSASAAAGSASSAAATLQQVEEKLADGELKGDAATITIGDVVGLDAGATPTVTNSGTVNDAVLNFGIPSASAIDLAINGLFRLPRTGKVYTTKMPKIASNQTTIGEKLDDNEGLVCETSTDTVEGQDDYADIPLFRWYRCNYVRDEFGHARPTAIEFITDGFTTTGAVDVGTIQMTPYIKYDDSNSEYDILSITDSPREGFLPWCTAVNNGITYPYVIHSTYFSGIASDGLLRSQPGLIPARKQSYTNMITNYGTKGSGYFGAAQERNTWQIVFTWIKYARKSSQDVFQGCTSYNFQYSAAVERSEVDTYFPLTSSQAANIIVGSYVSVGYGNESDSIDRGLDTMHEYADEAKVLRIEDMDDGNKAVYLDCDPFATSQYEYSSGKVVPITLSSMHWVSGMTDNVKDHHDGQIVNNGKYPYRIQGCEYAVGGYFIPSDTVMVILENNVKRVYATKSLDAERKIDLNDILDGYDYLGDVYIYDLEDAANQDYWIGDIKFNSEHCITYPCSLGSGSNTGVGDRVYAGGAISNNSTIEVLLGGLLWYGSHAGSSCLHCGLGLAGAYWHSLAAD